MQKEISDLKKGQASSAATSDMDDLESLFSSLDGSDFPIHPSSNSLFSPPPALSPPFVYRPRANSLPPVLPGQAYDPVPVAMDCQSPGAAQPFPYVAKKTDDVLPSHPAGPPTSFSLPQSVTSKYTPVTTTASLVQRVPVSSAQPLPITCVPSVSLELPPTSMSQTSSSALTLPFSISITQAESSVSPLLIPAPKASQIAQPVPIHTNENAQQILAYQRVRPTPIPPGPPQSQQPLPIPACMPLKTADEVFAKYSKYVTKDLIGRVATKLARSTYFGVEVLAGSTVSGSGALRPLDPGQLQAMRQAIRNKFPDESPTEFESIWAKCVDSVSRVCNYVRGHNIN